MGKHYNALVDALKMMGSVATMSNSKLVERVKSQMKDGDYVQLWQQMTNEPVSDRLVVVKSQFFDTVDWDIFVTEWLAMFSDANCSELNL